MNNLRTLSLLSTLVLLLGGCYAVHGDGYTYYTPFAMYADREQDEIDTARRKAESQKKKVAKPKKATPTRTVVTITVPVDERTQRQLRINELTAHVSDLRNQSAARMRATLAEMRSLNGQAREATVELIVLYQAEAAAAIGLVRQFKEKAAQLPLSDAKALLEKVEQRHRDEAEALLTLADNERVALERLEEERERIQP